jgi:hypothetical protein
VNAEDVARRYPLQMTSNDMHARATECAALVTSSNVLVSQFYRAASKHWRLMAEQMALLEEEPIYRQIKLGMEQRRYGAKE